MKKIMHIMSMCLCFLLMFADIPNIKAAQAIIIDGLFDDWQGEQPLNLENGEFGTISAFQDDDNLYIHVTANNNDWANLNQQTMKITSKKRDTSILFTGSGDGDRYKLLVKNTNYDLLSGTMVNGNKVENACHWEISLSKTLFDGEDIEEITFLSKTLRDIPELNDENHTEKPDQNEGQKPDKDPVEDEDDKDDVCDDTICIDGYYDDWNNISHVDISYSNSKVHQAAAVRDEENIYLHMRSPYDKYNHMNLNSIVIIIDGVRYDDKAIALREESDNGIRDSELTGIKPNHNYEMAAIIRNQKKYKVGEGYYTTNNGKKREDFEVELDIEDLEEALGLKEGAIANAGEIKFVFPSYGEQEIIISGTSTLPYLGVGICALFAGGALYLYRRKNKGNIKTNE